MVIASEEMHEASLKTRGLPVEVFQYSETNMKHSLFCSLAKTLLKYGCSALQPASSWDQTGPQAPGSRFQAPGPGRSKSLGLSSGFVSLYDKILRRKICDLKSQKPLSWFGAPNVLILTLLVNSPQEGPAVPQGDTRQLVTFTLAVQLLY